MVEPNNIVIVMSDEHSSKMLGCHGHPIVTTPNLDRLAANGVRFSAAYCNSPVCVPARAAFATGRYIHQVGLAAGGAPDRVAFSEYHGMGSTTGTFMVRAGRHKYIHSVAYAPLLFDLHADPEELTNLAADPAHRPARDACRAQLLQICDPPTVDAEAKRRQAEQLMAYGGREAVIARGDLGFSPPPGVAADFT